MKLSELLGLLETTHRLYGDVPVVLCDSDANEYFKLTNKNFELQELDGGLRISIGVNGWYNVRESGPVTRSWVRVPQQLELWGEGSKGG